MCRKHPEAIVTFTPFLPRFTSCLQSSVRAWAQMHKVFSPRGMYHYSTRQPSSEKEKQSCADSPCLKRTGSIYSYIKHQNGIKVSISVTLTVSWLLGPAELHKGPKDPSVLAVFLFTQRYINLFYLFIFFIIRGSFFISLLFHHMTFGSKKKHNLLLWSAFSIP